MLRERIEGDLLVKEKLGSCPDKSWKRMDERSWLREKG